MQKVSLADLKSLTEYDAIRDQLRARIIAAKRYRRVPVGQVVTLVFESRDTVIFQVQEMIRAERIEDPARVQEELDIYNTLLPGERELSATLFIELPDQARLRSELPRLIGVDESVALRIGEHVVRAVSEPGRSTADKTATVHYLRFPLTDEQRLAFLNGAECWLAIDHPNYGASTRLSKETQCELAGDLSQKQGDCQAQ